MARPALTNRLLSRAPQGEGSGVSTRTRCRFISGPLPSSAVFALLGVLALPATAAAQVATINGALTGPEAKSPQGAFEKMARGLRMLVKAQDLWFDGHDTFGRALRRSGEGGVVIDPEAGVKIQLLYVTRNSWTGRATHLGVEGKTCVVFVGKVPNSRLPATRAQGLRPPVEREPVCDAP